MFGPRTWTFRHRWKRHFLYERVTKPYFGSLRRATEALEGLDGRCMLESQYLDFIAQSYPDIYHALEWVRFHRFSDPRRSPVPLRLAITSLAPRPSIRDWLFEERQNIARCTGWYPLVQGSRASGGHNGLDRALGGIRARPLRGAIKPIGKLRLVEASSDGESCGTCIRVVGENGTVLLDSGFGPLAPAPHTPASYMVLSHFHGDHSGGAVSFAASGGKLVASVPTLTYLWSTLSVEDRIALLESVYTWKGADRVALDDGSEVGSFPVFHAPGSTGIWIKDPVGNTLVYFGDLCLANGFYDYRPVVETVLSTLGGGKKIVVLDATMAGRKEQAIEYRDTPGEVLDALRTGTGGRNAFFLSDQPEALFYCYLRVFHLTLAVGVHGTPVRILAGKSVYELIRSTWRAVLRRSWDADPVAKWLGHGDLTNYAESQRLYPLTSEVLSEIKTTEPVVVMGSPSDLSVTGLSQRLEWANVYLLGTLATRGETPAEISEAKPRAVMRVSSPDWSFHSSQENLVSLINSLSDQGVYVYLFHNYPERLQKFIKRFGLDSGKVLTGDKPLTIT